MNSKTGNTIARADTEPVFKRKPVILTPAAQQEVNRLLQDEDKAGLGLRLGIKGGGCSGLSYILDFTERQEGDVVVSYDEFEVFLDRKSSIYLNGTILDHQGGLAGRGFLFDNPMASNTCGCGESFSI
jgi:iron-sulfur cluster assembly protein